MRRARPPRPAPARRAAAGGEGTAERIALAACVALAVALHAPALWVGFVESDLVALDTILRTNLDALLRGGGLPGGFAPLSRELWWWWWGRTVQLDAAAFHVLNAAIAVAGGWWLHRAVKRWAGPGAALGALLAWVVFPPLGTLLAWTSGARELLAVLASAAALLAFAGGRWWVAGFACGWAALSGAETWLLALALVAADGIERPSDRVAARPPRLLPSLLMGLAGAALAAAATPPSPRAAEGIPALSGFVRAWAPAGAMGGLAGVGRAAPWLVLLVPALAALAVPRRGSASGPLGPRRLGALGLAVLMAGLLPVALAPEPPRAERFAVASLGLCMVAGALGTVSPWLARALAAIVALASLGAHATTVPAGAREGPFTSVATLGARASAIAPLLSALRPWCKDMAAVPRTFAAGVPADTLVRLVLDRGAPVVCRNARVSVRFLAELSPNDAARPFGVLRFDPVRTRFEFETADARVRALVGEGLLVFARHAPAAACFEAAAAERPEDRELVYPLVTALAAAQRAEEARAIWEEARRAGRTPPADSLARRLLAGAAVPAATRGEIGVLAAAVLADPTAARPHLELGRRLLELGRPRSAALEISIACGVGRRSRDVFWLARAYDALGASAEALEAYRAALAGGLDSTEYRAARGRLVELLRALGSGALGPPPSR